MMLLVWKDHVYVVVNVVTTLVRLNSYDHPKWQMKHLGQIVWKM